MRSVTEVTDSQIALALRQTPIVELSPVNTSKGNMPILFQHNWVTFIYRGGCNEDGIEEGSVERGEGWQEGGRSSYVSSYIKNSVRS